MAQTILDQLADLAKARERLDHLEYKLMRDARVHGAPWGAIGAVFGTYNVGSIQNRYNNYDKKWAGWEYSEDGLFRPRVRIVPDDAE